MKKAVVVGANGFLGSALVQALLSQDFEVLAVYHTRHNNIDKKAKLFTNEELLHSAIQPDFIFYLSGNYNNTEAELAAINETLRDYSLQYANAKMVYVSSTNVYGTTTGIITEDSPFENPGIYAQSKITGEAIVKAMPHFSIIRLAYTYGPGITNTSFIPAIIASAKANKKITLFGKGEREQDYIYIEDAVAFCIAIAQQKDNAIYLGATGVSVSNQQVAAIIQQYIDCEIAFTGEETGQSFYFNPRQTFEKLHWKPQTDISAGLKKMLS